MEIISKITAFLITLALALPAAAQMHAKSGQSIDLGAVYWVESCVSRLDGFVGVEMTSGPPGVTLDLRKEPVVASRQGCTTPVPGANVVATMPVVTQATKTTVKYRVTYLLKTGAKTQSDHSRELWIVP
jgi:hypothetical protein